MVVESEENESSESSISATVCIIDISMYMSFDEIVKTYTTN